MEQLFLQFEEKANRHYRAMCAGYITPMRYRFYMVGNVARLTYTLLKGLIVAR